MPNENNRRYHPRFEPLYVNATLALPNNEVMRGRILDSSKKGMAIALPENANLPISETEVQVSVSSADGRGSVKAAGTATVMRNWIGTGLLGNGKGIAVQFKNEITDHALEIDLLQGMQQQSRLASQINLAAIDIKYLGDYRRDLIACQMKLFILMLTIGVALFGAYFSLSYHSVVANQQSNPQLSFWRAMVASLPGMIAVACAWMVAQKDISIQRVDAYLLVLKQCGVLNQYPREYRGWESEYRKLRFVLNTNWCSDCGIEQKCGLLTHEDRKQLNRRGFFSNPRPDFYHIVIYMSFAAAFGLSTIAAVTELLRYQFGDLFNMSVASVITTVFLVAGAVVIYVNYNIRKGRFSVDYYKRCWIDILNKCRVPA